MLKPVKNSLAQRNSVESTENQIVCMTQMSVQLPQEEYVPLLPTETGFRHDRRHAVLRSPKFFLPAVESNPPSELFLG